MLATDNIAFESDSSSDNSVKVDVVEPDGLTVGFTKSSMPRGLRANHESIEIFSVNGEMHENSIKKNQVHLTWKNLNVSVPSSKSLTGKQQSPKKYILNGVSGYAEPGTLLAIMGSSGAGKSTLLNILTWRNITNLKVKGEILVNGVPLGPDITNISAYVQQDDLFVGALTVKEHLMFTAHLRMDSSLPQKVKSARVQEVMKQMGLKKCEHVQIGIPGMSKTISGGEMKRLSFASELLNKPAILFCDEPTSGLDSFLSKVVVECMKSVSQEGCTVLSTIHQPSSDTFELFDRLLLLSLGKVVYHGEMKKAMDFYQSAGYPCPHNYNPADHYILHVSVIPGEETESKEKIAHIQNLYENSNYHREIVKFIDTVTSNEAIKNNIMHEVEKKKKKPRYNVGFFGQFFACFVRSLKSLYRNPMVSTVKLVQTVVIAVIIGLIFQRTPFGKPYTNVEAPTVVGSLFLVIINNSLIHMTGVLHAFPAEIPIFRREHFDGMYSVLAYFTAKTMADLPNYIILPLLYTIIVYFMFGLYPSAAQFFIFYGYVLLTVNASVSYGYLVSAISPNTPIALTLGPAFLLPILIVGGFFIKPNQIPGWLVWLKYLSWFYYANELLCVNQWQFVDHFEDCPPSVENSTTCHYQDGLAFLHSLDFNPAYTGRDIGILVALVFSSRILALAALYFRVRESTR